MLLPIPVFLQIALLLHIGGSGGLALLQFVEGCVRRRLQWLIVLVPEICMGSARAVTISNAANTVEMSFMIFSFGSVVSEDLQLKHALPTLTRRTWGVTIASLVCQKQEPHQTPRGSLHHCPNRKVKNVLQHR